TLGMVTLGVVSISLSAASAGASSVTKSVVTDAGQTGSAPTYIFPFMTLAHFGVDNIDYFQYYMYRPLYWFGSHNSITVNNKLSVAAPPKFSDGDKVVTITVKSYKWSDGESLDATDVLFWLNIWHQKPTSYAAWFSGGLSLPTSVKSVKVSGQTVTLTMNKSMNPHWFLYNELSTITPLPLAWTTTSLTGAPGSAGCAKAPFATTAPKGPNAAKCKAVFNFLSEQSGFNPTKPKETIDAFPTYATSKIWSVVDGPWKLSSFTPTVGFTMVPNSTYSGPNKPRIKEYIDKAYTTTSAMFDAFASGTLDVGHLGDTELTEPAKRIGSPGHLPVLGPNNPRLTGTYNMEASATWQFTYIPYNFKSTGDTGNAGPIFNQLYFRQAMQHLMNQTLVISRIDKDYGAPNYTPVPDAVKTPFLSKTALKNPYPYSVPKAKALLKAHGWKVVAGGVDTCQKPGTKAGDCGKGIKKGAKLSFTFVYSTEPSNLKTINETYAASASLAGIHLILSSGTFNTVYSEASPCPKGCKWEINDWGGWLYSPDIYPAGTELLAATAGSNSGQWATPTSTALIIKSETGTTTLVKYENWEERHLPYVFENTGVRLYEVHKGLQGVAPMDPLDTLTPATFHWS
ncbi:MAG: ABC transporter substrate-binding protein, partial [Acidimicrobiales bacterium]